MSIGQCKHDMQFNALKANNEMKIIIIIKGVTERKMYKKKGSKVGNNKHFYIKFLRVTRLDIFVEYIYI